MLNHLKVKSRWLLLVGWLIANGFPGSLCKAADIPASFSVPEIACGADGMLLRNWLILGPFQVEPGRKALETDFLAKAETTEANVTAETFSELVQEFHQADSEAGRIYQARDKDIINFSILFQKRIRPGEGECAVYAGCVIKSDKAQTAYLLAGSDDSLNVWLNGELLHSHPKAHPLHLYDNLVRLTLKRGDNFLFVKVVNVLGGWEFAARLEPTFNDAFKRLLKEDPNVFSNPVRNSPLPLTLRVDGLSAEYNLAAAIQNPDGAYGSRVKLDAAAINLPTGIHRVEIQNDNTILGQVEVLSDPVRLLDLYAQRATPFLNEEQTAINIDALMRRWRILIKPDNMKFEDGDWQRKMIYTVSELNDILESLEQGRGAFKDVPGLHLRGFRSQLDEQWQHYRLFIPSSYKRGGPALPLIAMLATPVSANRPFLESAFIANHKEAEALSRIAEDLGIGIVWPGYRCAPYGNPCEFAHLDEVLQAVSRDYVIEPTRISLVGVCGAGMTSAMAAVRCPKRFAALGLVNPVLYRLKNRFDENSDYVDQMAYKQWLQRSDPVDSLAGIRDLPIMVYHDGEDPDHGPLRHSVDFIKLARAKGSSPVFTHGPEVPSPRILMWNQLLTWLAKQKRDPVNSDDSDFSPGSHEGPISTAFAEPFTVVLPTDVNGVENEACQKLARDFSAAWLKSHFGNCRFIRDVDLKPEIEKELNLVLLGNNLVNRVWARLADRLPLRLGVDSIEIGGQYISGRNLSIEAVFQHPDHPARKIVVVGGAHLRYLGFGTVDLSIDGWFNHAVWENVGASSTLLNATLN